MIRALAIVVVLASCGSKQPEPAAPQQKQLMTPEMVTFHGVLEPHWQAAPGPQRMKDTCAALPDFHRDADAIAKVTPPVAANADTWTTGTKQLVDAVAGLDAACQTIDPSAFEPALEKVHEAFRALVSAAKM